MFPLSSLAESPGFCVMDPIPLVQLPHLQAPPEDTVRGRSEEDRRGNHRQWLEGGDGSGDHGRRVSPPGVRIVAEDEIRILRTRLVLKIRTFWEVGKFKQRVGVDISSNKKRVHILSVRIRILMILLSREEQLDLRVKGPKARLSSLLNLPLLSYDMGS